MIVLSDQAWQTFQSWALTGWWGGLLLYMFGWFVGNFLRLMMDTIKKAVK